MHLRVATYNIHRCVGTDGRTSTARIASVVKRINADVTALQEVSFDCAGPVDLLGDLARPIGAEAIPGPTLVERSGRYGNAVLTRLAPAAIDRLDISVPGREPRGAVALTLAEGGLTVRLVATHLGLRPLERRRQMRRLMPLLDAPSADVTILLGDFNEWFNWARPLRWLTRRLGGLPAPATFPSRRPLLALDRIWVHPPQRVTRIRPFVSPTAAVASDHLPLIADLLV